MKKTILAALISLSIAPGMVMAESESVSVHVSEPVISEHSFHETEEQPTEDVSQNASDSDSRAVSPTKGSPHVIIMNNNGANSVTSSTYHCTQTPSQETSGEYTCTKTNTVTTATTSDDDDDSAAWTLVSVFLFAMAFFLWLGIIA